MPLERNTGIPKETLTIKQKNALMLAWAILSIGGAVALAFNRGLIGDIGTVIFMTNVIAPGAYAGGKAIKDSLKHKERV